MLMTVGNIGHNHFAQCPWRMLYMCEMDIHIYWKIMVKKTPDKARWYKTQWDKTRYHPDMKMSPSFEDCCINQFRS